MNYKYILIFLFLTSCAEKLEKLDSKSPFISKGFAYIYNDEDFINKIIKKKMDNNSLQIAHNKLKPGTLIKIINLKTNDTIILKNNKRLQYPDFYKILITQPVADQLNLQKDSPLIELIEIKKNKFFIAKKSKIFQEEKKIHNNAPVEGVIINNISQTNEKIKKVTKDKFYIIIAEFYSKNSANLLNERITRELPSFNSKKLFIKSKKTNKISLISGPYSSVNLMKNDYILFKNFGFEELDITINE